MILGVRRKMDQILEKKGQKRETIGTQQKKSLRQGRAKEQKPPAFKVTSSWKTAHRRKDKEYY